MMTIKIGRPEDDLETCLLCLRIGWTISSCLSVCSPSTVIETTTAYGNFRYYQFTMVCRVIRSSHRGRENAFTDPFSCEALFETLKIVEGEREWSTLPRKASGKSFAYFLLFLLFYYTWRYSFKLLDFLSPLMYSIPLCCPEAAQGKLRLRVVRLFVAPQVSPSFPAFSFLIGQTRCYI